MSAPVANPNASDFPSRGPLTGPHSIAATSAMYIADLEQIQIHDYFVGFQGTVNYEVSDDGVNWVSVLSWTFGSPTTGNDVYFITGHSLSGNAGTIALVEVQRARFIRLNVTAYTAGDVYLIVSGRPR